ncbi:PAS domain S-box protein [Roseospira visakhapatnamensis]|uniref:Sensory/regulatory protein RpfC n=1 Tax=Roseospira visakhapatnamensis TaxID=390880 RepID=A0A7W6RDE2_9PROT|nr:PAS domain S-box protein [Roseospira visakhapatnamensis]MBB4265858.1 PAS domain S-box-containing protein [Roseospira visakhapatnamensis]
MNDRARVTVPARTRPSIIGLASAALLGVALVGILVTGSMTIVTELAEQDREIVRAQAAFLDRQRGRVRDTVQEIVRTIQVHRDQTVPRVRTLVRARTEEAVAMARHLHATYGDRMPLDEIKDLVRETLRPIRAADGRGYLFAATTDGVDQLGPPPAGLDGAPAATTQGDADGERPDLPIGDIIDVGRRKGADFYRYIWPHPDKDPTERFEKITYVHLFEPFDWVIGSSEYLVDMETDTQARILDDIRRFPRPDVDAVLVTQWDGQALIGRTPGTNILDLEDVNGFRIIEESIRVSKHGGGFLLYEQDPRSAVNGGKRLSYVAGVPDWGWSVEATVGMDAVQGQLDAIREATSATVRATILQILLLMLLMSAAAALLVRRGQTLMRRNLDLFLRFFQDASRTASAIDLSRVSFSEFAALAHSANAMIEALGRTQANLRESQDRFELAVRGSGDALWLYDSRTRDNWLSPRYLEMLGYSPGELPETFETVDSLTHPDDRDRVRDAFYAHLQSDVPYDIEYRVLGKDGSYLWMRSRAGSVRDAEGCAISTGGSTSDVTERKQAEDRLRFTQEAMDNAIDGILWVRIDTGRLEYANNSVCRRLGYSRDEMVRLCAADLDDTLTPDHLRDIHASLATTPPTTQERRQRTRDGTWLDVEITMSPARYGDVDLLMVWTRDVSALAAQTRNFVALLENTRDFVLIKDTRHRYQAASQTLAQFTGHASWRDLLGRTDRDLMPAERAEITVAEDRLLLAGDLSTLDVVQPWIGADGAVRWMDTKKQPIRDGSGQIVGLFGICRDITDRRQSEEQLRRNRQLLEGVLENSPALIYAKDRQGRYIFVNRQWERRFNRSRDQVIGHTDMDLFPEDLARQYRDNDLIVMASNQPLEQEELFRDGDGETEVEAVLLARKVPLPDPSGQAEGICGISTDITDRKAMEEELSARVEDLAEARRASLNMMFDLAEERKRADDLRVRAEAANRSKSNFLAAMSHEIRTPMNGVVGMIDLLRETPLSADQRSMMNTVRESAFSLLQIINDILDHSKIEAGRLTLESIPVSVRDILEGVTETLLADAAKTEVRLFLFVDPAIPPRVLSDHVRLRQILFNLAGNAIKFTQTSPERRGEVRLRADRLDDAEDGRIRLAFVIRDNGIGMSPDTVSKLFQPFSQADQSTTRRFGGTGLGLSICRTLTDMMDGTIDVESVEGTGSTFTVTLPMPAVADAPAEDPDLSGLHIGCLVRDEDDAEAVSRYCTARGATAFPLASLADAARMTEPIDILVLSDAWGQAARRNVMTTVQERAPATRFVVLTGGRGVSGGPARTDAVTVETGPIRRSTFLRAVAVAAGRASPDMDDETQQASAGTRRAPSLEAARAAGHLILVAEDNVTNQDVIRRQLALLGFACEVAQDGVEALALIRTGHHALLLSDCHMPRMDGFALTAAVRALEHDRRDDGPARRLPIIAITANALQGEADRCLAAGMDDYLSKPLEMGKLKAMLSKWMPRGAKGDLAAGAPATAPGTAAAKPPPMDDDRAGARITAPAVDRSTLAAVFGDDTDTIKEVLADFVAPAGTIVTEVQTAVAHGQAQAAAQAAHKLKSAARAIGAHRLADLCQDLEQAGKAGDIRRVADLAPQLAPAFAAVEAFVRDPGKVVDTAAGTPAETPAAPPSAAPPPAPGPAVLTPRATPTPAPKPGSRPAIDPAALATVLGDDSEAVGAVLADFLEPSRTVVADIDRAMAERIPTDVVRAARRLQASARTVGAEVLADLCQGLEQAGAARDWGVLDGLHARLGPAFAAVEAQIQEHRAPPRP